MKYKLIKQYPYSGLELGDIYAGDEELESFKEFFKLVEYNYNGRILKVGDKIGGQTIDTIDPKNELVFFREGDFMWMDKIPNYYSVIDWTIHTHAGPPIIETQFTCNDKKEAEQFILWNCPLLSIKDVIALDLSDPFDDRLEISLKKVAQKKLDERSA